MGNNVAKNGSPRKIALQKKSDSTFDAIWKFYYDKNGCKLSKKQEEVRERWERAYALLCAFKTRRSAAKILEKHYKLEVRICYMDINNSMMLFGDPQIGLKSAKRAIVNEWNIKGIEQAWTNEDWNAFERLIARYDKRNGLESDSDNPIADMLTKLKPTTIVFSTDAEILRKQAEDLMVGADDVEYANVIEGDEE